MEPSLEAEFRGSRIGASVNARMEKAFYSLLAVQAAVFVLTLCLTRIQVPFWDMLSFIDSYIDYRDVGDWIGYLWLPDNEHHSVWSRLLTVVEIEAFDGKGLSFQIFSAACLLGGAAVVWREFARTDAPPTLVKQAGVLACLLFFIVPAAVNCGVPMNGGYIHATGFLIFSLVLLDGRGESDGSARFRCCLALLAAVAASFGNAVGLLAWPILVWSAWQGGARWPWCAALAALGMVFSDLYLRHLHTGTWAVSSFYPTPQQLSKIADYMLAYLGLPWTRSEVLSGPGRMVGAVLLSGGTFALVRLAFARPPLPRLERICLGLIMFSLGTAVLASFGRVDQIDEVAVPVRYAVLMTPLQVGLLGLLMRYAARVRPRARAMLSAAGFVCGLLIAVVQIPAAYAAIAASRNITGTVERYIIGKRDETMQHIVFPDLTEASQIFARIQQHRLYSWLVSAREPTASSKRPLNN